MLLEASAQFYVACLFCVLLVVQACSIGPCRGWAGGLVVWFGSDPLLLSAALNRTCEYECLLAS